MNQSLLIGLEVSCRISACMEENRLEGRRCVIYSESTNSRFCLLVKIRRKKEVVWLNFFGVLPFIRAFPRSGAKEKSGGFQWIGEDGPQILGSRFVQCDDLRMDMHDAITV